MGNDGKFSWKANAYAKYRPMFTYCFYSLAGDEKKLP